VRTRLHLVEQPYVLNCDHRLVSEGGDQLNLPARKWSRLRSCHCHDADAPSLSDQRNAEHRAETGESLPFVPSVFRISKNIGYVNRCDL
jgi:hypothetical protein